MSEPTTTTPSEMCELSLDYVYGELDDAKKAAFEAHAATCARCQAELKSFGRVRAATKVVMPATEPTPALTGALHAQLMHAAAQRKPQRGKLLAFPRQILAHPAWAAAAMFVIVGGAITFNALHDKLEMAPRATSRTVRTAAPVPSTPATAPAELREEEQKPAVAGAQPAQEPAPPPSPKGALSDAQSMGYAKALPKDEPPPGAVYGGGALEGAKEEAPAKKRAAPARAAVRDKADADLRLMPATMAAVKPSKKMAKESADDALGGLGLDGESGGRGAAAGAVADSKVYKQAPAQSALGSAAPTPALAAPPLAQPALGERRKQAANLPPPAGKAMQHASVPVVAAPMASAPPPSNGSPPSADVAASETVAADEGNVNPRHATGAASAGDDLRKRAVAAAKADRCFEAAKLFAELERRGARLDAHERDNYQRCLAENKKATRSAPAARAKPAADAPASSTATEPAQQ